MPQSLTTAYPAPDLQASRGGDGVIRIQLIGAWNLQALQRRLVALTPKIADHAGDASAQWDLRGVDMLDHAGAMLLWRAWGGRRAAHLELKPEHELVFSHLDFPIEKLGKKAGLGWLAPVYWIGDIVLLVAEHMQAMLLVLGQAVLDCVYLIRQPANIPWREVSANIFRTGTQALGITALVGFLIGVVLSYLSAQQLKLFGADAFIVNILGISILRELGPVLAAILIAGRSGSAITAQLGVMRVTQELDAMAVMGIPYTLRLILPKMLALAISMPLIVLWTDAIALAGGMVSAHAELGIGYITFLSELPDAVPVANLGLGLFKGATFGLMIALVACHFGLRIKPNTESLGAGTTNSVVTAITVVIIFDAIFAVVFKDVGIS